MRVLILMLSVAGAIAVTSVLGQEQGTEKPVKLQELPPAVQEVVKAQSKSATVRGFSMEVKDGARSTRSKCEPRGVPGT